MKGDTSRKLVSASAVAVLGLLIYRHSSQLPLFQPAACPDAKGLSGLPLATNTTVLFPQECNRPSGRDLHKQRIRDETVWLNGLIRPVVPDKVWDALPHFFRSWLRNYLLGTLEYFALGLVWSYYIYQCFGTDLFPTGNVPTWANMAEQMKVACISMPLFSLLPSVIEAACERGYTMAYGRIDDMGYLKYIAYLFVYMFFVEFGIYWMHRLLHDIPAGYRYLHKDHHKYNKEHTMSPFAGLAFHPVDGILQAFPHLVAIMFVPTHFFTHEILLFMEAVWTANIHDNIHLNLLPFMGAGWHTIHHTTYKHNYGHYFVFMDWFYGTLISPEEMAARERAEVKKAR